MVEKASESVGTKLMIEAAFIIPTYNFCQRLSLTINCVLRLYERQRSKGTLIVPLLCSGARGIEGDAAMTGLHVIKHRLREKKDLIMDSTT
jgi:hypothetical protein